ncbi:MAG: hypothetical protein ACE5KG_03595 [Nitrososphaerales archaeon]
MRSRRAGISQFVAIFVSVLLVLVVGSLLLVGFSSYFSSGGRINSFALNGQLNTQRSGESILTVTVRNTGTADLIVNATNPGDVRIVGPGNPTISKVGPLGTIQLTPGDSMTVVASLSGVQQAKDYVVIINLLSQSGSQNGEQIKMLAR